MAQPDKSPEAPAWVVVVPVKHGEVAKTRLSDVAGALRPELARAFAVDCVAAAAKAPGVGAVIAVTDDPEVTALLAGTGVTVVADAPAAGLNAAVVHGAEVARTQHPGWAVAVLSGDLPALRPAELGTALASAARHERAFVADTRGVGTTLLTATGGVAPDPHFEGASRAAHRRSGAVELDVVAPSLRRDVDTPVDLWDAERLGVGPATREVVDRLASAAPSSLR